MARIAVFATQISAADVRTMLREDALALALGSALVTVGLWILGLSAIVRRRMPGPAWLGVFALLYGARLLIRTDTFATAVDIPRGMFDYADAIITYVVPVPLLLLFARVMPPGWRQKSIRFAYGLTLFAIGAIATDAWLHRPHSARLPNNLIAVALIGVLVAWTFRRGSPPSRELRTARIAVASFALTAIVDCAVWVSSIIPGRISNRSACS